MELHQGVVKNALSNSLDFLDKFRDKIGEAYESVENQIDKTPWGYKLKKQVVESGGQEFRSTEPIKDFIVWVWSMDPTRYLSSKNFVI